MRLSEGDEVSGVWPVAGDDFVCLVSQKGHALIFPTEEIPLISGPGKGVIGMRVAAEDILIGANVSAQVREGVAVETPRGRQEIIRRTKYEVARRGGKGRKIIQRGELTPGAVEPHEIPLP